jgi:aryl-alcohol dehydrogenase-like predicted oxidoreductase
MTPSLALGSAQFGSDYGISNPRGRVSEDEVCQILKLAADCNITRIDAAYYDGDVERTLGRAWPFPSPFKPQIRALRVEHGLEWVESRLKRSIAYMGLTRAHAVLVDSADDLLGPMGDALWERLQRLKSENYISHIGIACQTHDQPLLLAKRFRPDIIQVPVSIFDQRLIRSGALRAIKALGIEVQARSVFLQGLIFLPRQDLPLALSHFGPQLSKMRRHMLETGTDPLHAALGFVMAQDAISSIVVGVTSAAELRAIIAVADRACPKLDWSQLSTDDERVLDPRQWTKNFDTHPLASVNATLTQPQFGLDKNTPSFNAVA